jgi:hypothetical protein
MKGQSKDKEGDKSKGEGASIRVKASNKAKVSNEVKANNSL